MTDKQIKHIKSIIDNRRVKHFGVEIPLTDEQVKEFEKMVEPKYKNPYERIEEEGCCYAIGRNGFGEFTVYHIKDYEKIYCKGFESGNYYNDEKFARQIAMELNLQRKLRKFTYDNGWSEELWENDENKKWYIRLNIGENCFEVDWVKRHKEKQIYYVSAEIARRAIDEIILPFMKENPSFKW